jgi:alpha-2-macroglobulin
MTWRSMRRNRSASFLLVSFFFAVFAAELHAQAALRSTIVPDTFLRGYDPVTVFYDRAVSPVPGGAGPADGPGAYLTVSPTVAGEYRWLDAKTVLFLPAVPWPALREITIQAKDRSVRLTTMMVVPSAISPSAGSTGLEPISAFTLTFPSVLDADVLARMIRIEVRDLPGLSTDGSWWIASGDFSIRESERSRTATSTSFVVSLKSPIPYGKYAILYFKLSLDDAIPDSVAKYVFQTRADFRLVGMGSGSVRLPVTPSGSTYTVDQAVNCGTGNAPLFLEFSEAIRPVSVETLKRLVSFEPAVRNLTAEASGQRLVLRFSADRDKAYRISVTRQPALQSISGRPLSAFTAASFYFYFKQAEPYLTWKTAQGVVERYGPQLIPMEGRGTGRVDLRIYKVDPENINYWPFPAQPITIDENTRPPMPGEEPPVGQDLARQIRLLPSPDISKLVDLPISAQSVRTSFGFNVGAELAARFGSQAPGTYLIGYRTIDKTSTRSYVRLTVTDLCLSTVEEESEIVFVVTSLRTGAPVAGASVRVESRNGNNVMQVMFSGVTDQAGQYLYQHTKRLADRPARIVVTRDNDVLVLDPRVPPPEFANNHWYQSGSSWLDWIASEPQLRRHERRTNAYMLTERPVYKPEETVHIIGWIRDRQDGLILKYDGTQGFFVAVQGPGGKQWTFPADLSGNGRFYVKFAAPNLPTGEYSAVLRFAKDGRTLASLSFRMEAYRVPMFEVNITGPDKVPLDAPFELVLTANYYAGGRVVGEQVNWDVTRYPYTIASPRFSGFLFSTDERFSASGPLAVTGVLSRSEVLDDQGSSRVQLNPAAEKDARASLYVARGTVVGADRQAVTATKQVYALPPFSIGLKVDRFLTGKAIKPQIIVLDHTEFPLAGTALTVRLAQRQWHSYIAETDFTTGEARYVTDTVDKTLEEQSITSTVSIVTPTFAVTEAGVYIVTVSARDFLGRQITVSSDLFVSGPTPVAWEKVRASIFEITPDLKSYKPGQTAKLLLKSPYQDGMALVVVEHPQGNKYDWVKIANGQGVYSLPITAAMAPGVPVGILLERGRVAGTEGTAAAALDLGRPSSVGGTVRLAVDPVANRISMDLAHESQVLPASTLKIRITLKDWTGKPLDGEAALWLVDKAVLALGTEAPLEPLSPFIQPLPSYLRLRDTRNLVFGNLPSEEIPGGDAGLTAEMAADLFERTTVRKNFQTVPYFNPAIPVKGGVAEVEVVMPDNLTDFAIRAVGTSGFDKVGSAKSMVSARLPVIVQQVLPRFVRPMDSFNAGGIGRVVEGSGGPALAGISVEGLKLKGPDPAKATRSFTLDKAKAERLLFPMSVPETLMEADNAVVAVSLFIQRNADKARDAFRIELPVRNDIETRRLTTQVSVNGPAGVPMLEPTEPPRKGTVSRTIIVARDPRLLSILRGLNYLTRYSYDCLEQRLSKLYPAIMLKDLLDATGIPRYYALNEAYLKDTFAYMAATQDDNGLFGYWPGSRGYVTLTAYAVEFLVSCRNAKIEFDTAMLDRAVAALRRALRSDYSMLLSGWSSYERVEALAALDTAGIFDEGYANDLALASSGMGLYSQARLLTVLQHRGRADGTAAQAIAGRLQASVVTKMEGNRVLFAGFQARESSFWGGPVLGSGVKTIGALMDAIFRIDPKSPKLSLLTDYLVSESGDSGWGNTQDNMAALRALKTMLTTPSAANVMLEASSASGKKQFSTGGKALAVFSFDEAAAVTVSVRLGASADQPVSLVMDTHYQPLIRGSLVAAENAGFAVTRETIAINPDGSAGDVYRAVAAGATELAQDAVLEEHVTVVNFSDASFVAVSIPLAAGLEPLNPNLAGAPWEATPLGRLTAQPSYSVYGDDRVEFYYDSLPKGTYNFYFRTRASFTGSFSQPPARAELMYALDVRGRSNGTEIRIAGEEQ